MKQFQEVSTMDHEKFGLRESDRARGPRQTVEDGHFSEEIAFGKNGEYYLSPVVIHPDNLYFSSDDDEERSARFLLQENYAPLLVLLPQPHSYNLLEFALFEVRKNRDVTKKDYFIEHAVHPSRNAWV